MGETDFGGRFPYGILFRGRFCLLGCMFETSLRIGSIEVNFEVEADYI
jgi:hypothetical protein